MSTLEELTNELEARHHLVRDLRAAIARAYEYAITGAAGFAAGELSPYVNGAAPPDLNADLLELQEQVRRSQREAALYRNACVDLEAKLREMLVMLEYVRTLPSE